MSDVYGIPEPEDLLYSLTRQERKFTEGVGIEPDEYQQASQITGGASPLMAGGVPISASKAEIHAFEAIYWGDGDSPMDSAIAYYDFNEGGFSQNVQFNYELGGSPVGYGKRIANREAPAPITLVPTSTTNPLRPRTIAAGYDSGRRILTCVFRDGTYYNYYEVTPLEWGTFKRARSKGKYIYTYLDSKPRGVASVAQISSPGREVLYRISRTHQIRSEGRQPIHSKTSKAGTVYGKKYGTKRK